MNRQRRVIFLCQKWGVGFGVSKVVYEQAKGLSFKGFDVAIACIDKDPSAACEFPVYEVPGRLWGLKTFLEHGGWDAVIAHTMPFMGLLPNVRGPYRMVVDHGEPLAELMDPSERNWRKQLAEVKSMQVAPAVDQVVTISQSVRRELGWPAAVVNYNGADHFVGGGRSESRSPSGSLRLICISRMGAGERRYKGFSNLVRLKADLGDGWEIVLAGRGSDQDAKEWREQGLRVENNLSDEELAHLVLDADALVSFSRWEGFNLPLAEWSHVGKPAYALGLCAHPEVTPFVYDSYEDLREAVSKKTRDDFRADGQIAREFCRKFTWEENVSKLDQLLRSAERSPWNSYNPLIVGSVRAMWKLYSVCKENWHKYRSM